MNDDLEQLLIKLRLTGIARILDEQLTAAESKNVPFRKLLAQLLRAECHHRQESALTLPRGLACPRGGQWSLQVTRWSRASRTLRCEATMRGP